MGKQIYLTDKEIEWLKKNLNTLSEMEKYWENEDGEKDMVDRLCEKIE